MANTKISELASLTTVADDDVLPVVDVSDTTMAPTGSTKRATRSNFVSSAEASEAEALADTAADKVMTPRRVGARFAAGGTMTGLLRLQATPAARFGSEDIAATRDIAIRHYTNGGTNGEHGLISLEAQGTGMSSLLQIVPDAAAAATIRSQLLLFRTTGTNHERWTMGATDTKYTLIASKKGTGAWFPIEIGYSDADTPANDVTVLDIRSDGTCNARQLLAARNVTVGTGTPGNAPVGTIALSVVGTSAQSVPVVRVTHGGGTPTGSGNRIAQFAKTGGTQLLEVYTNGTGQILNIPGLHDAGDIPIRIIGASGQTASLQQWRTNAALVMQVDAAGKFKWPASLEQTTVGAAGGASAPPATPTKWIKIVDSAGTELVVPAYAAA